MNKYPHAGLTFKAIDWIDLTPSGLVRLGSAYVNRFHRMLFIFNPCRVGSDEYKERWLRIINGIRSIPEGFNMNNIRRSLVKEKVSPRKSTGGV